MSETQTDPTITYFLAHLELLPWRDYLQEMLTIPSRHQCQWDDAAKTYVIETESPLYIGKLVQYQDQLLSIIQFVKIRTNFYHLVAAETHIYPVEGTPLLKPNTPVVLEPGVLQNYPSGDPLQTTVGRIILNALILVVPFGNTFPFINTLWKADSIEKMIGDKIILEEITVDQVNTYIRNSYFLGHAPELMAPNLSEKALTTDPQVAIRKQQLLEEHKEALAAGDAVVMSKIEQELIAMDKAYLKGDSSMGYYIKESAFSVQRKKLLLTHGMVEAFGDAGNYDFIPNSLEEGWTQDNFPKIANEIRAGSYSRAKEVAKGGEESKFLARVFQEARLVEEDCGTTRGLDVVMRPDTAQEYVYRNHIIDDVSETLTKESVANYIGKTIRLRSPLFCQAPGGYCFGCMGKVFKTLDQKVLATAATAIGAQMSVLSLKKQHGIMLTTTEIKILNDYVV